MSLREIRESLATELINIAEISVAGTVVGVAVSGEEIILARGTANLNTGQPFTHDTGFLAGSVTKVLTTTALLRLVERGEVDLDAPAKRYVPEFALTDAAAADAITVRMLLNHTNGMDADFLMPNQVRGRDATRSYTEALSRWGVLFEPGRSLHYSNPGFNVATRIIEEKTGLPFERAIRDELFGPAGMAAAIAVQTQALLRRTAVGAFAADGDPGSLRAATLFSLPESSGGAGSTPIVTIADLFAFGRTHLNNGVAPHGTRVLAAEYARAMRAPTYDLGIAAVPPIGLGWWLAPMAGTTVATHTGGSPGGASKLSVIPEFDAVVVSFSTGPGGWELNDRLHSTAIERLTGNPVRPPSLGAPVPIDPGIAGEYRSFARRITLAVVGDELVMVNALEPIDEEHRHVHEGHLGSLEPETTRFRSAGPGLFAPMADGNLLAILPATPGRRVGLHYSYRYTPKVG